MQGPHAALASRPSVVAGMQHWSAAPGQSACRSHHQRRPALQLTQRRNPAQLLPNAASTAACHQPPGAPWRWWCWCWCWVLVLVLELELGLGLVLGRWGCLLLILRWHRGRGGKRKDTSPLLLGGCRLAFLSWR